MTRWGGRLKRWALSLALCTLGGCGDSGGGGGGSTGLVVELLPETSTVGTNVTDDATALAALQDGDFLLLRAETDDPTPGNDEVADNYWIAAARFDRNLAPIGDESVIAGPSNQLHRWASACSSDGSIAVTWTDMTPFGQLPSGITLDTLNAFGTHLDGDLQPIAPSIISENTIGEQWLSHVACHPDESFVVAWLNRCGAVERRGNTYIFFTPEECDSEPADGAYLQRFDRDDEPVGPMQQVAGGDYTQEPAIASLPDNRVLVVTDTLARIYDGIGDTEAETTITSGQRPPLAACTTDTCVVVTSSYSGPLIATLLDPDNLSDAVEVEVKASSFEVIDFDHDVTVFPDDATLACDSAGTCLITWRLVRESRDYDAIYHEELGIYAVALDADSGETGGEQVLIDAADLFSYESPLKTVAIGKGKFVSARNNGEVVLNRIDVH